MKLLGLQWDMPAIRGAVAKTSLTPSSKKMLRSLSAAKSGLAQLPVAPVLAVPSPGNTDPGLGLAVPIRPSSLRRASL